MECLKCVQLAWLQQACCAQLPGLVWMQLAGSVREAWLLWLWLRASAQQPQRMLALTLLRLLEQRLQLSSVLLAALLVP